ncbi:MAG: hypothetical protein H0T58_06850 [Gemmatimonadales bacterium]|nr:hypothetical protein [Gemmatimonadales bacterium]
MEFSPGWRYPRIQPSLPHSYHSVPVPKGVSFWRKALAFAVVPLVYFTSQRQKMGQFANSRPLSAVAWGVAATIACLNGWLLIGTFRMLLA